MNLNTVREVVASSDEIFIPWASEHGLCANVRQNRVCCACANLMRLHFSEHYPDGAAFRCKNSACSTTLSVRTDHWTWNLRLSLRKVTLLFAYWVDRRPIRITVADTGVSEHTTGTYFHFFRQLAERAYRRDLAENPLGSTGGIVQIDESLFNRAKYHRGSALRRPQMWFFGAVDCDTNRIAVDVCEDRKRDTLTAMIQGMVAPGAEVWSDSWKAYQALTESGYNHRTVNHRFHYRDPDSGVHTNRIEGNWGAIKEFLRGLHVKCRAHTESYVHEYCFRRNVGDSFQACWQAIIRAQEATRPT